MTTSTITVFDEVFAVAKVAGVKEQSPGQSDHDFLLSIAKAIGDLPDDAWDKLSITAQEWYVLVAGELNSHKPMSPPQGFLSKTQLKPVPPPARVEPKPVPPPPPVPVSSRAKKPDGVVTAIRKTIILNPDWTTRRVHEYLVANGWPNLKLDVVSVNAGDIRKTIEAAKELGKWKD